MDSPRKLKVTESDLEAVLRWAYMLVYFEVHSYREHFLKIERRIRNQNPETLVNYWKNRDEDERRIAQQLKEAEKMMHIEKRRISQKKKAASAGGKNG